MSKANKFKEYLNSKELVFVMEAHNAISAKIAEVAGFKALWASSLSISAAQGVRDCNEMSWTQILEIIEFMNDAVSIPIMMDGDSGHGDYNNFRRLVRKLNERRIAAVCLEDKIFPKTNSFMDRNQHLLSTEEVCGKIRAGKDIQDDKDFCIIARTEALICGLGMQEALERALAYYNAGADGILIHSKKSNADEIIEFAKNWNNICPLVIVPTTYYTTPTSIFREINISLVIWANHNLRASMKAMENICKKLVKQESLNEIEGSITSIEDIFTLVNNEELILLDKLYLQANEVARRVSNNGEEKQKTNFKIDKV